MDDDEEDLGAFGFLSSMGKLVIEEEAVEPEVVVKLQCGVSELVREVDRLLLLRDSSKLVTTLSLAANSIEAVVVDMGLKLLEGRHLELLQLQLAPAFTMAHLRDACIAEEDAVDTIRRKVLEFIEAGEEPLVRECRAMQSLILATAYLELYCQANYTGPELRPSEVEAIISCVSNSTSNEEFAELAKRLHASSVRHLESDGEPAYRLCELPHALVIARSMFLTLCDPMRASWSRGITLKESGTVESKRCKIDFQRRFPEACRICNGGTVLRSSSWRSARAAVVHARLLPNLTYTKVPTLWKEVGDWFGEAQLRWDCSELADRADRADRAEAGIIQNESEIDSIDDRLLQTQLYLEWGLAHHHFSLEDKGKRQIAQAQRVAGLQTRLTGAMGKRTKHQQEEHAQMLLYARSSLLPADKGQGDAHAQTASIMPTPASTTVTLAAGTDSGTDSGIVVDASIPSTDHQHANPPTAESIPSAVEWQHAEWELGRRLVSSVGERGEEAAVREVMLDAMDGGSAHNILLEGGPQFSDPALDRGGALHAVDQAVILALCMDVANSNPTDGLTTEVMMPYLTRVLQQIQGSNWMIHSTALLERSWLEFQETRTADRAMLQIQALLDQHSTKLTLMQCTYQSAVEDSAPAHERLRYLHAIVYPAQYELKRDLAQRYLQSAVVVSALGMFRELELWDEVVTCYQLMEKPHRAEMIVRERLKASDGGETPHMLTALADLTADEMLYERAWELSRHRYPRAKRTLAKICFDRGDFHACSRHLEAALAVQPLVATAWYLKGLAAMRLGGEAESAAAAAAATDDGTTLSTTTHASSSAAAPHYDAALQAFARCVQQDMEIGEAWANCGAIHMKRREHAKAYVSLTEALRHKRDSWQVMENLMICCLVLTKWQEACIHMGRLLDLGLRGKSGRPIHKEELRHLALMVAYKSRQAYELSNHSGGLDEEKQGGDLASTNATMSGRVEPMIPGFFVSSESDPSPPLAEEIPEGQLPEICLTVEALLVRITNSLPSDPEVWDILADFNLYLGRFRAVLDCRVRQFRTVTTEPGWEKEQVSVERVVMAADLLIKAHDYKKLNNGNNNAIVVTKADMYACRSLLQAAQRKLDGGRRTGLDEILAKFELAYSSFAA